MKQLRIFSALLMCLFALSFAACGGGDDDENIGGGNGDNGGATTQFEKADFYGGWKYESGSENTLYYFDDDNSGIMVENAGSEDYTRSEITYILSNDVTSFTLIVDGSKEKYTILQLTDKKLVLEDSAENTFTFKRYTGNIDKEYPERVTSGTINGHKYVDLGLSVKWACCNVGAESPEEYGDYFAWGETTPKSEYTEENSKTYRKNIGDISGNPAYDAATANWGGSWRMPTRAEMQELIDNCTWTWTIQNGVKGCKVKGPNGNSIFLPAAGRRFGSSLNYAGNTGFYWRSTPDESRTNGAYYLYFYSGSELYWGYRHYGLSVRPVSK